MVTVGGETDRVAAVEMWFPPHNRVAGAGGLVELWANFNTYALMLELQYLRLNAYAFRTVKIPVYN